MVFQGRTRTALHSQEQEPRRSTHAKETRNWDIKWGADISVNAYKLFGYFETPSTFSIRSRISDHNWNFRIHVVDGAEHENGSLKDRDKGGNLTKCNHQNVSGGEWVRFNSSLCPTSEDEMSLLSRTAKNLSSRVRPHTCKYTSSSYDMIQLSQKPHTLWNIIDRRL